MSGVLWLLTSAAAWRLRRKQPPTQLGLLQWPRKPLFVNTPLQPLVVAVSGSATAEIDRILAYALPLNPGSSTTGEEAS